MDTDNNQKSATKLTSKLMLHGAVAVAALAIGYQLNSSSATVNPVAPEPGRSLVTIQSFPSTTPVELTAEEPATTSVEESTAATQTPVVTQQADPEDDSVGNSTSVQGQAADTVSAVSSEMMLETPLDPFDAQLGSDAPMAVPLPELMPVADPGDGSERSDELLELEYVAALQPSGEDMPEGLVNLEPGTLSRLTWHAGESLYGSSIPTPVLVAQGKSEGPTLCLTAAVHGDEINGIETVRRVMYSVNPDKLKGRVIGVPIVNLQAFERHSRYLPDRRDLNRFFPGNTAGSSASRIARSLFDSVVSHCDALVDLHTGSFHRTNLPQLRANLDIPEVVELTQGFGATVILHSEGGFGTLRAAATRAGIPAVTLEAGEPLRIDGRAVKHSEKALFTLMNTMGMYKRPSLWGNPEPTYYSSMWIRADKGGMLIADAKLGKRVRAGDVLGTVVDPITNAKQELAAPADGRVIGMALDQFVMPGYAAFHLGIEAPSLEELESAPDSAEFDHSVASFDGERERDDSE